MPAPFDNANSLIARFKGGNYVHGLDVVPKAGGLAAQLGRRVLVVCDSFPGAQAFLGVVLESLAASSVQVAQVIDGAAPNAPREDVLRITASVESVAPDAVISVGGGSTIDAAKAACVLQALGGSIDDYFGTGLVTRRLEEERKSLTPHLAIQTAASSSAHLTKYSNITDINTGQKKLIVDDAIVPQRALFDYAVTLNAPRSLTVDGALDGMSHMLEVYFGAVGKPYFGLVEEIAREGIHLVFTYAPQLLQDPANREARQALGLATDLGGYSIMLGGTSGPHLTSFSLVDLMTHGRACGLLNPYYTVFFAPAIEQPLRVVARICEQTNLAPPGISQLSGRPLGIAVAESIFALETRLGVPTRLSDVPGFHHAYIERALSAAKNPQLRMKLENMPVPLTAEMVDDYMGPVLQAAASGDLSLIRNVTT